MRLTKSLWIACSLLFIVLHVDSSLAFAQTVGPIAQWIEPGMSPTELIGVQFKRHGDEINFPDGEASCIADISKVNKREIITFTRCDTLLNDPDAQRGRFGPDIRPSFFEKYLRAYEKLFGPSTPFPTLLASNGAVWRDRIHGTYSLSLANYIEESLVLRFEKMDIRLRPDHDPNRDEGFQVQ